MRAERRFWGSLNSMYKMRSRTKPDEEENDGLFYDAPDEEAAPLPPPRYFYLKRVGAALMVAAMVFACTRRDADEEPPPPPRIATPTLDTNLPHPHEWAPPHARQIGRASCRERV